MTEKLVTYRDRQELQSADLTNSGLFVRKSLDDIVIDTIEYGKAYSGMTVTKSSATELTVSTGRLYALGGVYALDTASTTDLFNKLPQYTGKRVAVVAWGQVIETDVQPRDFLIDATTGETQPSNVSMQSARVATISIIEGNEGADLPYPVTSSDVTVVAYAILDRNGIVSIEQWEDNRVANLRRTDNRAAALEFWQSQVSAQVNGLRTDLANLAAATSAGFAGVWTAIGALTAQLELLRNQVHQPAAFLEFTSNHFLDYLDIDIDRVGFDAIIDEGMRLPYAASDVGQLALLNPQDVNAHPSGNLLLPAYRSVARLLAGANDAEVRIAVYVYQVLTAFQRMMTKQRTRYGDWYVTCTNGAWWQSGSYDAVNHIFTYQGSTYQIDPAYYGAAVVNHNWVRMQQFWIDTWQEAYTDWENVEHTVSGQILAQTFLNSQDGWLSSVSPTFTRIASTGAVTYAIAETTAGMPDVSKIIMITTVNAADLKVGKNLTAIPPTFLTAGKRYALLIITAGDHYLGTTTKANTILQGTMFAATDGAYFQGDVTRDLCVDFYFAQWSQTRYALDCDPFILAGGIHEIDVLNTAVTPAATSLRYEVQINGIWRPLDSTRTVDLSALPPILPLHIVFTGTTDLMPACGINEQSQVILSRPKTAAVICSKPRQLGAGSTIVKLNFKLEHFDPGVHTFAATLHTGETYAVTETADVVSDFILPDGSYMRTLTFNISSATKYYIRSAMGVTSIDAVFLVAEMVEYAQA